MFSINTWWQRLGRALRLQGVMLILVLPLLLVVGLDGF